jgi:hypothetical protein
LSDGTRIEDAVFDLSISWKAAANTHAVPLLTVAGEQSFKEGAIGGHQWKAFIPRIIGHITRRICGEVRLTNMKQKEVLQAVTKLAAEADAAAEVTARVETGSVQELWRAYTTPGMPGASEFHLVIWGSQKACCSSVFHAYEAFILDVLCAADSKLEGKRLDYPTMGKEAERLFGKPIADSCVLDAKIETARDVRNALAHRGGRENDRLKAKPHGILVDDSRLQVMPANNKQLFDLLKERAYRLAEAAK